MSPPVYLQTAEGDEVEVPAEGDETTEVEVPAEVEIPTVGGHVHAGEVGDGMH